MPDKNDKPVVNFVVLRSVEDYVEKSEKFRTNCASFKIPGRDSGGANTIYIPYCEKQRFDFGQQLNDYRRHGVFRPPEVGKPWEIPDFNLFVAGFHDIHCPQSCRGYRNKTVAALFDKIRLRASTTGNPMKKEKWTRKEIATLVFVPVVLCVVSALLGWITPEGRRILRLDKPQTQTQITKPESQSAASAPTENHGIMEVMPPTTDKIDVTVKRAPTQTVTATVGRGKVKLRIEIGDLITEGTKIRDRAPVYVGTPMHVGGEPDVLAEWTAWIAKVEQFLNNNFDPAEVAKFRSLDDPNTSLNSKIHGEIAYLEQLLDRVGQESHPSTTTTASGSIVNNGGVINNPTINNAFPPPKGTYELTDERRDRFLKSLSTQTAPRDTLRIGCTGWSETSCVAAGRFLLLLSEAGWQIEENKVFRLEPQIPIVGVSIATRTPSGEPKDSLPPHQGRWRAMDESHKTIYWAFRSLDIPIGGSTDDSLKDGSLGIYFGSEPK